MIDQLKSIGIEKGKPFNPDGPTQATLTEAAQEADTWLENKYGTMFRPYNAGTHWALPVCPEVVEGSRRISPSRTFPLSITED